MFTYGCNKYLILRAWCQLSREGSSSLINWASAKNLLLPQIYIICNSAKACSISYAFGFINEMEGKVACFWILQEGPDLFPQSYFLLGVYISVARHTTRVQVLSIIDIHHLLVAKYLLCCKIRASSCRRVRSTMLPGASTCYALDYVAECVFRCGNYRFWRWKDTNGNNFRKYSLALWKRKRTRDGIRYETMEGYY